MTVSPQVVEELRKYSEIEFSAPVTGRYDIIMRIKNSNPEQANQYNQQNTQHPRSKRYQYLSLQTMDSLTVRNLTRRAFGDSVYYQSISQYRKF